MKKEQPGEFTLDENLAMKLKQKYAVKVKLAPPHKNLYFVTQIVNTFIDMGAKTITGRELQSAVEDLGWRSKWNLDPCPIDDNGLQKHLSGLVGGNGLRLPKERSAASNIYRLPKKRIDDTYFKTLGINPELVKAQAYDQLVIKAVLERRAITFRYRDDPKTAAAVRKFHPHFYGPQSGVVNVEGYQVGGYSSSGLPSMWRNFRYDEMKDIAITDDKFTIWPGFKPDCQKYAIPYAIVKTDDIKPIDSPP